METIEDLARRAATAALAEAAEVADPDEGLRRIRADVGAVVAEQAPAPKRPARAWAIVAGAAAVVGLGTAAVVIAGRDGSPQLGPDPTPTNVVTTPAPSSTAPPAPSTSSTTPAPSSSTDPIGVSYLEPPPDLVLNEFATLPLPGAIDDPYLGGVVAQDGALLRVGERSYTFVGWDGTQTPIEFEVPLNLWVAGPGPVAYGTTGTPGTDFRLAAVAFGGERAGQEVWSMSVPASGDMLGEVPFGAWGHGPTGITQRDNGFGGQQIAAYVDASGAPLVTPIEAPEVFLTHTYDPAGDVVQSLDGTRRWQLDITAHPEGPVYEGTGRPQATPTPDGGAVIWRHIGQDSGSGGWHDSTLNVFGVLRPDGTGSWHTMPPGATVLASDLWGTVFSWVDGSSVHLATADPAGPGGVTGLCHKEAGLVVETLVGRRLAGVGDGDCIGPDALAGADVPECWIECSDGRITAAAAGAIGEVFNPLTNETSWSVPVAVTFTNEFGFRTQRQERWALHRGADGIVVSAIEVAAGATDAAASEALVREYLDHLAAGRYDEAAALLGAGEAEFADRPDLQQLGPAAETDVAAALRAWCDAPPDAGLRALCGAPAALSTDITATTIDVTAWYLLDGRVVTGTFRGGSSEGIPFVQGVPPRERPYEADDVATLAAAFRSSRMVVPAATGFWLAADGAAVFVDTGGSGSAWLDTDHAYWSAWDDEGRQRSMAVALDGTEVCAVDGAIHHVRELADGRYVATVERPTADQFATIEQTPVPAFAVDCATGSAELIQPISWTAEAASGTSVQAGGRTFQASYDAEGNVVIIDEDGGRLTGPEWAISAGFSADGATVVYGEGGVGNPGVHDTNRLVARDTTTDEVRWSLTLPQRFTSFWVVGDQVIVAHEPPGNPPSGIVSAEYTIVGLAAGNVLGSVPAMVQIGDIA